jgi:integrase
MFCAKTFSTLPEASRPAMPFGSGKTGRLRSHGFSRWLVRERRAADDPLAVLARLNAKSDRRHARRALHEAELRALLAAAGTNAARFGELMGADRAMLYALAMTTGYRASELASLCPPAFDLAGGDEAGETGSTVTVRAGYTKNRQEAAQPLPIDVAEALRVYLDGRPVNQPVWHGDWHKDAAEMLRGDLAVAGIPYRDANGRVCDFHALRHSYITLLERSGVSPKLAQELARHSDIRLTMNVYTHARLYDLAGAVEGLPALLGGAQDTDRRPLQSTGTEGSFQSELKAPGPRPAQIGDTARDSLSPERDSGPLSPLAARVQRSPKKRGNECERDSLSPPDRKLSATSSTISATRPPLALRLQQCNCTPSPAAAWRASLRSLISVSSTRNRSFGSTAATHQLRRSASMAMKSHGLSRRRARHGCRT